MNQRTITIDGDIELQDALKLLGKDARNKVGDAVQATGIEIRGDIVKRIQKGPATGAVYDNHQASAPGEAPATDTGRLASSITYRKQGELGATIGSNVVYAAYLEFGTQKIEPRPAWLPAVEDARPKYIERLEKAMGDAIRRAGR